MPDLLLGNTSIFLNLFEAPDFNLQLTKPKNQNPPSPLNSLCLFSIVNLPPPEGLVGWAGAGLEPDGVSNENRQPRLACFTIKLQF